MEVSSSSHRPALASRPKLPPAAPLILLAAVSILTVVLCLRLSPATGVLATIAAFFLMALPGALIGMAVFGWDVRRQPEALIFGAPLGLMFSGYTALMLGYSGHWSVSAIVPALLLLAALAALFAWRRRTAPLLAAVRPWKANDYMVLGCMLLAVLGFVSLPFSRVGELTPFGHAYTWLFGFDFILRSAYAASITIGLPIDHMHMAGMPLTMYLVGYVLPAFSYSLGHQAVHMQKILLVAEVLQDLAFVACLLAFWRMFASSAKALAATAVVALAGYSYYGWFAIAHHFAAWLPVSLAARLQSQFVYGSVSHMFQRLFMVEPQAILALSIFVFVLTAVWSADRYLGLGLSCLLGLTIGVEFGVDSWLGLTLAGWFAGVQLMRLWGHWNDRRLWAQALLVGTLTCLLWSTFFAVHMINLSSRGLVSVGPYWWGLKFGILQYAIEYGPMLLLGLPGLVSLGRNRPFQAWSLGLIAAMAVFQDIFISIAQLPHFRIGNRLLPIVFLAAIAWLFGHARLHALGKWLAAAAIVLAVPTLFTDIAGASNVLNLQDTYYVRSPDLKACEWIRTHLPITAIVQSRPDYVGYDPPPSFASDEKELSLIPDFALRRSALGEEYSARSVCGRCDTLVNQREADMDAMFRAPDAAGVLSITSKYHIGYLYVGPFEQARYPGFLGALLASPRFEPVYDADSVHVFRIVEPAPAGTPLQTER